MYKVPLVFSILISWQSYAAILTTDFNGLPEGVRGQAFTNNGITFSGFDDYLSPQQSASLNIDRFDMDGLAGDAPPFNVLTFGGYAPGEDMHYGRFGSADIHFDGPIADNAYVYIYGPGHIGHATENKLTLQALFGNTLIATDSITFDYKGPGLHLQSLSITSAGNFTRLRLLASGEDFRTRGKQGTVFIALHEVLITTKSVPEPGTITLFSLLVFVPRLSRLSQLSAIWPV